MRKNYPRYFASLFMLAAVCCVMLFGFMRMNCKAAEGNVIYTAATGGTTEDLGNGTKSNPYNLFDTALKNAKDGDIIYILEPRAFLNAADNSPYIIDKAVTIKGNGNVFLIRAAGIVLGADVTFENVVLNFGNRYHDALFANGHTLTLTNVNCESGSRQVDVFGGGLYMNGKSVAQSGNDAQIIMNGGGENFGNIYAGAMNGKYSGNVTISLTNLKSASNMVVNASGADETYVNVDDFFNLDEPAPPTANRNYTISGNVNISVNDCNISLIQQIAAGTSASCNLTVQTNGKYNGLIAARNMDLITVKGGGTFAPVELTQGTAVTLTGASALSLSGISSPVISQLVSEGSKNRLILGKEQFVTITKSFKGNFIFETENGSNGYSGAAQYDFAYIRLQTGALANAAVSFTCIPGMDMTLDKTANYTVSGKTYSVVWKTSEATEYSPFAISGLEIINPTVISTVSEFYNSPVFDAKVTVPGDVESGNYYFDLVPIKYEVTFNNKTYTAEAEFDGISYVANIPELRLTFFAMSDWDLSDAGICVTLYMDGSSANPAPPSVGTYEIKILPMSSGEQITETAYLVIVGDSDNTSATEQKTTTTQVSLSASGITVNNKLTISATVRHADGTNALNAATALYVNGREYTASKPSTSGGTVSYTLNATQANGFVIGENNICILYKGASDGRTASVMSQGSAVLTLQPVTAKIKHSAKNQTCTYAGSAVKYSAGTVKLTDSSNNILKENITPEVYYKKNGVVVTPAEPGSYDVYFRVVDDMYGTIETKAAVLTIQSATPKITLTGSTSSDRKVTLQAVADGVSSGYVPIGRVRFYMNGTNIGQVNLSYGEAVLNKQLKAGTYTFMAEYEPVYGSRTPYYTAQQSSTITVVVKSSSISEESTKSDSDGRTEADSNPNTEGRTEENSDSDMESKTEENSDSDMESKTEENSDSDSDNKTEVNTEGDSETDGASGEDSENKSDIENPETGTKDNAGGNSETEDDSENHKGNNKTKLPLIVISVLAVAALSVGCVFIIIKKKNNK